MNGVQDYPISVTSIYFREFESVEIPSKIAFHPDMVLFFTVSTNTVVFS